MDLVSWMDDEESSFSGLSSFFEEFSLSPENFGGLPDALLPLPAVALPFVDHALPCSETHAKTLTGHLFNFGNGGFSAQLSLRIPRQSSMSRPSFRRLLQ